MPTEYDADHEPHKLINPDRKARFSTRCAKCNHTRGSHLIRGIESRSITPHTVSDCNIEGCDCEFFATILLQEPTDEPKPVH